MRAELNFRGPLLVKSGHHYLRLTVQSIARRTKKTFHGKLQGKFFVLRARDCTDWTLLTPFKKWLKNSVHFWPKNGPQMLAHQSHDVKNTGHQILGPTGHFTFPALCPHHSDLNCDIITQINKLTHFIKKYPI